jgi:aspartyl protease family protein
VSDHHGPWGGPQAPPPPRRGPSIKLRVGFLVWLGLIGAAALTFWVLAAFFPGQLHGADWGDALRLFGLLALVSSGLVAVRRVDLGRTARQIGLWAAIVLVLLLGYSYRDDLFGIALRLRGALIPAYAAQTGPKSLMIQRSEGGGFYVIGQVDQAQVRFAIDTGASDIVLSPDDARRIGVDPSMLKFSSASETANGVGYGAPIVVKSLTVGPIRLTDVPVTVNQAPMSASLLGASFLRRLSSFEIRGDQLFLKGPA